MAREACGLPHVCIDLNYAGIPQGDQFFRRLTVEFFEDATRRHPRFPLVRRAEYGVALCPLGPVPDAYWSRLGPAARRNCKKATRLGYAFGRIAYNDHLDDITEILRSAAVRQGRPMPERLLREGARPTECPTSLSPRHDYPYFGVLRDGRLLAYAGCLVAGELCEIQTIYGHAEDQPDGIIPLLIASIAGRLPRDYPDVRYYSFGTYLGATEGMRRFKRKFDFRPHRVTWRLGE